MRRTWRAGWLLLALLLFGLAAWLMRGEEREEKLDRAEQVQIPRYVRPPERERIVRRRTLGVPDAGLGPPELGDEHGRPPADPMLRALPPKKGQGAIVIEANALRNSPLGERILACIDGHDRQELDSLKQHAGFDLLTDLDRIALSGSTLLMSGNFGGLKLDELSGGQREAYGSRGQIAARDGSNEVIGVWDDQLVILGGSRAEVEAIDRSPRGSARPGRTAADRREPDLWRGLRHAHARTTGEGRPGGWLGAGR
jgi:hypothetical protein